jgi:hypothetical protein
MCAFIFFPLGYTMWITLVLLVYRLSSDLYWYLLYVKNGEEGLLENCLMWIIKHAFAVQSVHIAWLQGEIWNGVNYLISIDTSLLHIASLVAVVVGILTLYKVILFSDVYEEPKPKLKKKK